MGVSLTRRGIALLSTATLMLVLAATSSSTAMFLFGAALILALAVAWRAGMRRSRTMAGLEFAGLPTQTQSPLSLALSESSRVNLRVTNRTGGWIWRLRWEISPQYGLQTRIDGRGWVRLPPASVLELPLQIVGHRIGVWVVDGIVGISEDPLGLVVARAAQKVESRVEILPMGHALVRVEQESPTNWSGERSTSTMGHGGVFRELREWQSGDSVRRIAWRATARRGVPIVRTFQDERVAVRLLVLDAAPSMREGNPVGRLDAAIHQAWNLVEAWAGEGDLVGVQSFVDRPIGGLRPGTGPVHYAACADHVLALANLPHDSISDWTDDELAMMLSMHLRDRRNLSIRSADGSVDREADLLSAWLEQRYATECDASESRLMSAGFSLSGKRLARLLVRAGWPLPVRVDVRPVARDLALTALLVEASTLPRGSDVHVMSDMFEQNISESLSQAMSILIRTGKRVHVHVPWAPWFASAGKDLVEGPALHSVFSSSYGRSTRPTLDALRSAGASVSVFGQPPSPA